VTTHIAADEAQSEHGTRDDRAGPGGLFLDGVIEIYEERLNSQTTVAAERRPRVNRPA
jgi:hypothetical protein